MAAQMAMRGGVAAWTGGRRQQAPPGHCLKAAGRVQVPRRLQPARQTSTTGRLCVVVAAAAPSEAPHLQLATAKLPADVDTQAFVGQLFQWASTLTTNGRNLPFALPQRVDRLENGFQISLLRVADGGRVRSVADVVGSVEPIPGVGNVLFVRLLEGEASSMLMSESVRASGDGQQRLQALLPALVDVPLIMNTMRNEIKRAVMLAR